MMDCNSSSRRRNHKQLKCGQKTPTNPSLPEIFIGGLPSMISHQQCMDYFTQFGNINSFRMMYYKDGKPRGFAFLKFQDLRSTRLMMRQTCLSIQGKKIECKLAMDTCQSKLNNELEIRKRVFVKNITADTTELDLKSYFRGFGVITDAKVIKTAEGHACSRGFGFVTFQKEESAKKVLRGNIYHYVKGSLVECRRAITRADMTDFNLKKELTVANEQSHYHEAESPTPENDSKSNLFFRRRGARGHPNSEVHIRKLTWKNRPSNSTSSSKANAGSEKVHSKHRSIVSVGQQVNDYQLHHRDVVPRRAFPQESLTPAISNGFISIYH